MTWQPNPLDLVDARLAIISRDCAIVCAGIAGFLTLVSAALGSEAAALLSLAMATIFAWAAVRDQRRADVIFARGVAAALAESDVDISDLSEAA